MPKYLITVEKMNIEGYWQAGSGERKVLEELGDDGYQVVSVVLKDDTYLLVTLQKEKRS